MLIGNIVTGFRQPGGGYMAMTSAGPISLAEIIGSVRAARGIVMPLGTAYSDTTGEKELCITIYIELPDENEIAKKYFNTDKKANE